MPDDKRERIHDKVIRTFSEFSGKSLTDLTGQTELIMDLNLDSLAIFEIVIELEEAFDLRIPDEDIERVKTIDDVVDYIAQRESPISGKQD